MTWRPIGVDLQPRAEPLGFLDLAATEEPGARRAVVGEQHRSIGRARLAVLQRAPVGQGRRRFVIVADPNGRGSRIRVQVPPNSDSRGEQVSFTGAIVSRRPVARQL